MSMDFNNLTRKQMAGITIILVSAAVAVIALPRIFGEDSGEEEEKPVQSAVADIQDPDTESPEGSKLKAYGSAHTDNNGKMWDSLEKEYSEDDPYAPDEAASGGRARGTTEEEVYGSITAGAGRSADGAAAPSNGATSAAKKASGTPKPGDAGYKEYRMNEYYRSTNETIRSGEAAKDSIRRAAEAGNTESAADEPMSVIGDEAPVSRTSAMSTLDGAAGSGFSSLGDESSEIVSENDDYPFECMFTRTEKLRNGSRVSVRLLEDMVVGGTLIPKNTHLMAMCTIGDRLQLTISSVEMNSRIYSLGYEAYDTDGGQGIYCPDLNGEARRSATSRGLSTVSSTLGSRLGRIASDAVKTGVSIAQTRSGEVTVSVPAGYRFFIVKKKR
jgi:hypothetical protein